MSVQRCGWGLEDPAYLRYHDEEWGVPVREDRRIFEMLVLESFQSGLSWLTILRKREGFRSAFAGFDPRRVAAFGAYDEARLLADAAIVRNRAKVAAAINNAERFLDVADEFGSFAAYQWSVVGGRPVLHRFAALSQVPPHDELSTSWSKDLKARGFRFLGPTTVYSHMQATGMVLDHLVGCFRHAELAP